ncbi:hypothetical protein F4824DRAFT_430560 [Ustulina deusta]|nr:hypothetical protein F4824DRAFT_430560 [Ustulina deusta]
MPIPNHSVVPITKDDIPTIGTFLQNSKLQLAINRFLVHDWPNFPLQKAHYTRAIEGGVSNPQTTSLKVINHTSGQPVAHLFYTKKASRFAENDKPAARKKEEQTKNEVPVGFAPEVYWAAMNAAKSLEPNFDTDEYIELTHLYVEPSSRRQGIGSWLLQIAQEAAMDAKLPLTMCSEPNNHDFFANRGFKDTKNADLDLRNWAASLSGYGVFRISRMVLKDKASDVI